MKEITKASNVNGRHKKLHKISGLESERENTDERIEMKLNLEGIGQQEVIWINVVHCWVQWGFV
jgi:hypothetical protein